MFQGDAIEILKTIPDHSVDLVLTDPPYNIGVQSQRAGQKTINQWDVIPDYINWCVQWITECQRVLKPNGVLYFWHNDIAQCAQLLEQIRLRTDLELISFCIWDKGDSYRAQSWQNRKPGGDTALRSWFNVCEYCFHFFNAPKSAEAHWKHTGLDRINSNPDSYKPIKDYIKQTMERLELSNKDIAAAYTAATGKKPYMLRHYFQDSQFSIPTKAVWESVYEPLGFCSYEELRQSYEELRQSYEELRQSYEDDRNIHNVDPMHCNIWHRPPIPSTDRLHTCQKPIDLLRRLIRVSSNNGGVVLDCFMGSGSTGVAAIEENRDFIGIELDPVSFRTASDRIAQAERNYQYSLF